MIEQRLQSKLVKNTCLEGQLLLYCIRPYINKTATQNIRNLTKQEVNWNYLLKIAEKHRVVPLLYRGLNVTSPENIPTKILNELRSYFFSNITRNLMLTSELFKLLEKFQELNIRTIPYKGTVLASSIYGEIYLRQVGDIDIIINKEDLSKTKELLSSQSYQITEEYDQELTYFNKESQVEVDIHWEFTPTYFPLKVDFDTLWDNRQTVKLCKKSIVSLSAEDLLFILCIQIAKDCWERQQQIEYLAKVCDIAEVIHKCSHLNWSQMMERGKGQDVKRIIHFSLYLAKELFAITLPAQILQEIEKDTVAISLAHQVCADLFGKQDEMPSPGKNSLLNLQLRLRQLIFYLRMRETLKYKIKYFLAILKFLLETVCKVF